MKAKLSFDTQTLKQFFVAHTEKVALLIFAAIFGWMCYRALQVQKFPMTPEDLHKEVVQTRQVVTDPQRWKAEEHDVRIPDPPFAEQAEAAMKDVDAAQFALATPFNPPNNDNRLRREDPVYLPASDVRASFAFGAIRLKGEGYAGKKWAMVTALVPVADQTAEYQKKFQNALFTSKEHDTPAYIDFEVERAEGAGDNWKPLDVPAAYDEIAGKYADFVEVVDKKYVEKYLTFPLPGLAGSEYDASAAHPDEIPFGAKSEAARSPAGTPAAGTASGIGEIGAGAAPASAPAAVPRRARGAAAAAAEEKDGKAAEKSTEAVKYKLLRFIDYSVENVKSYRYRVRLVLKNPNHGVDKMYLKDPSLVDAEEKITAWSEPSKPMSTPRDNRLLAGGVKPATGTNEAKATLLVVQWAQEHAAEVKQVFEVGRGDFLNFSKDDSTVPVPGTARVKKGAVRFETNSLLLDMTGGEVLTVPNSTRPPLKAPAEMLIMGPDGRLEIRSQVGDLAGFTKGQAESAAPVESDVPAVGEIPGEASDRPKAGDPFSLPSAPGKR